MEDRARQKIEVTVIFILDRAMAPEHRAGVPRMAELRSNGWSIVDRPLPSRLIGGSPQRYTGNVDDFKPSERELTHLVRPIERLQQSIGNRLPPLANRSVITTKAIVLPPCQEGSPIG